MWQREKRTWNRMKKAILVIFFLVCAIYFMDLLIEGEGSWAPDYPKVDLSDVIYQSVLSEADYHTVLLQTGLGKDAADELRQKKVGENRERAFAQYQDEFFSSGNYECRRISSIVYEERIRDKDGNLVKEFDIPNLKNGDILITKATHSIGWRHGHAAIVTDAVKGETLEAIVLGNPSDFQNITKWQTYPSFILLRLKDDKNGDAEKIAQYAKDKLLDVPYGLLTGIPNKAPDKIKETQCAHLVWYPYAQFGYDLDSDGSWLVTPKDIANSDLLEVVQIYGVNPEELWP